MALCTTPGLLFGRLANFINAELWGRASDVPWAVIFPGSAAQDCPWPHGVVTIDGAVFCARHPSQLYEAALEGLLLGALLIWLAYRRGALTRPGMTMGVFFAGYGLARSIVELFRQADPQFITADNPFGYVLSLTPSIGLTMGQILSLPMLIVGLAFILLSRRRAA
jgi:phosphatidylglycerol:prolipoprotein diacylglycerol transferase